MVIHVLVRHFRPPVDPLRLSRLYRPISTMTPYELSSDRCPKLRGQPVWVSEATEEEIARLDAKEAEEREAQLRRASVRKQLEDQGSATVKSRLETLVTPSLENPTINILTSSVVSPSPATSSCRDDDRPPPPPQTFTHWYRPSFQSFKALRLFQIRSNPSSFSTNNTSILSTLFTTFFPSHHRCPSFSLPRFLFSNLTSPHGDLSTSPKIPGGYHRLYNAVLLPDFALSSSQNPSDLSLATASKPPYTDLRTLLFPRLIDPPQPRERTVFLGGFPTTLTLGELRIWLVRRSLLLGDWTDCVRVAPLRTSGERGDWKGGGVKAFGTGREKGYKRGALGGRKHWEMEEWEGKGWWETGGVRVEKMA